MRGRVRVSDGPSLVACACAGAGVTVIDRMLMADELASGALIELLPGWRLPAGPPLYAVYQAHQWLARCFAGHA